MRAKSPGGQIAFKTPEAGAATSCLAAASPELAEQGGVYLEDCAIAAIRDDADDLTGVRSYAVDPEAAERLWALSETLIGERVST